MSGHLKPLWKSGCNHSSVCVVGGDNISPQTAEVTGDEGDALPLAMLPTEDPMPTAVGPVGPAHVPKSMGSS